MGARVDVMSRWILFPIFGGKIGVIQVLFQTVQAVSLPVTLYTAVWRTVRLVRTSQHCAKTVRKLWHVILCIESLEINIFIYSHISSYNKSMTPSDKMHVVEKQYRAAFNKIRL